MGHPVPGQAGGTDHLVGELPDRTHQRGRRNGLNTTPWPDFTFRFRRLLGSFDPESYNGVRGDSEPRPGATRRLSETRYQRPRGC